MTEDKGLTAMTAKSWVALFVLAISTFTIVTTELAPVGLLTPLALGLKTTESAIGMTVSLYAWVGALSALLASVLLGNIAKKRLLLILTVVFFVSNIVSAESSSYQMLVAARVIGALAHGAFWSIIGATAVAMVPPKYLGVATSIVFGGVSAASVFGVPLSNYIGIHLGWRPAFWLMASLSIVTFIGITIFVPRINSQSSLGLAALKNVLSTPALLKIYFATLLAITAHFAAFTYIEPWLHAQPAISTNFIPVALLVYGVAGLAGNFLTGLLIDKHLKAMISLSVLLVSAVLLIPGLIDSSLSRISVLTLIVAWGIGVSGIFVGFQTWVLRLAADQAFPASSIYVSFFNLAIGLGASIGAWMVSSYSLHSLYIVAGVAIGLSILLVAAIPSRHPERQDIAEKSYDTN